MANKSVQGAIAKSLLSLGVLMFSGFNTAAAIGDLNYKNCQAMLTNSGPYEQPIQPVKSRWYDLFHFTWGQGTQVRRANKAILTGRESLDLSKSEATKSVQEWRTRLSKDVKHAVLQMRIVTLLSAIEKDISEAKTVEAVQYYKNYLANQIQEAKELSDALLQRTSEGVAKLGQLQKDAPPRFDRSLVQNLILKFPTLAAAEETTEGIDTVLKQIQGDVNAQYDTFREADAKRRARELRVDVAVPGRSTEIIENFIAVSKPHLIEPIAELNSTLLASFMDIKPELKGFVYHEMQVFRRSQAITDAASVEALKIRAAADWKMLNSISVNPVESDVISMIGGLRLSLVTLSNPRVFAKVVPKGSMLKLNVVQREKILAQALQLKPLTYTIIASVMPLPPLPDKPVKPTKPARPELLEVRRSMQKSVREANRAENNRRKAAYQKAKQEYPALVAHYVALKEQRAQAIARAKESQARRLASREAFVNYLAQNFPEVFPGQVTVDNKSTPVAEAILEKQREVSEARFNRLSPERASALHRRMTTYSSSSSLSDSKDYDPFLMYFLTGNPMWFINQDIAVYQLYGNLIFGGYTGSFHSNSVGYYFGVPIQDADQAYLHVQQFSTDHPDVIDALRAYDGQMGQDFSVGPLSLPRTGLGSSDLDPLDPSLTDSDIQATGPDDVDKDWDAFKAQGDGDWKIENGSPSDDDTKDSSGS